MMDTKKCKTCKNEKKLHEFNDSNRKINGVIVATYKKSSCKECLCIAQRNYKKDNLEKTQKQGHEYYLKVKDDKYKREKERYLTDEIFKLKKCIRARIKSILKHKSKSSLEILGCPIDYYKKWIEFTMEDNMSWENYGTLWHIDHVKPISSFDITNEDEMLKAFNWKNTRAKNADENMFKSNKIIPEEIEENRILLEKFLNKKSQN
jgi:hypothetical protein